MILISKGLRQLKTLRNGSRGKSVLALQKFLKKKRYYVVTDGSFGPATKACVKWYQHNEGLKADGIFGPKCRESMMSADKCKYQEFKLDNQTIVIRMDRALTKCSVVNPKRQTIKQMFKSLKVTPTLVLNGTLYNTGDMTDLARLKKNGIQLGGKYYDDDGLGMDYHGQLHVGKDSQNFKDFMGFSPAILLDGKSNDEKTDLDKSFTSLKHPRTMVQVNDDFINVFIVRGRARWRRWYGASLTMMTAYCNVMANYDDCAESNAGNFDGGGSSGAYTKRGVTIGKSSRGIANGLAFYVEGV